MRIAKKTVKYTLYFFNLLIFIISLSLFGIGLKYFLSIEHATKELSMKFTIPPILMMGLGIILFFIVSLGCWSAVKSNKSCLFTYSILMFFFLVIQTGVAVYAFIEMSEDCEDRGAITKDLWTAIGQYENLHNITYKWFLDHLHQDLRCCGVDGPGDWDKLQFDKIPSSCCDDWNRDCNISNSYQNGCAEELYYYIIKKVSEIGYIVIGSCLVELVPACLALYMRHLTAR